MQPFVLIGGALILFAGLLGLMLKRPGKPEPAPRKRTFDAGALASSLADVRGEPVPAPPMRPAPLAPQPAPAPPLRDNKNKGRAPPGDSFAAAAAISTAVGIQAQQAAASAAPPKPEPVPIPQPPDGRWSVNTRIEAARAYMQNGDTDNARSMLEAALIEGNAAQQEAAFKLLDQLEG
jgi:FimV-like protein